MNVGQRTGTTPWFHAPMASVQYHIGEAPRGGPAESTLFQRDSYIPINPDHLVCQIFAARISLDSKEARIEQNLRNDRDEFERRVMKANEDMEPELRSVFRFTHNKANHGKHSRNQVLT